MSDLTDLRIFLASLLRPIINEAIQEQLYKQQNQQHSPQELPDLLDIKGAGELLGMTIDGIYGRVHDKTIPVIKKEGVKKLYFSRKALLEWLNEGNQQTNVEIRKQVKKSLEK